MISYLFNIPGKPFGKQRPRFGSHGAYTPKETILYENLIKTCFTEKYPNNIPARGAVRIQIVAVFPIPVSWSKKKKIAAIDGVIYPKKPDWDNIGKIVCDALNGIAFDDDSAIHHGEVWKKYGDVPGVNVLIEVDEEVIE